MYIRNKPFVVAGCKTSFEASGRMVVLEMSDDLGGKLHVKLPECMMAVVTGQFLRERLFGLH